MNKGLSERCRSLGVTTALSPADGVRRHEAQYCYTTLQELNDVSEI